MRGSAGHRRKCPVEEGTCISLQPAPFQKGVKVTIPHKGILLRAFEPLSLQDARSLGHVSVEGARASWSRSYGPITKETTVWAISLVLGNRTAFYGRHAERYLRGRTGSGKDYTIDPRQAARGEGAVPRESEMMYAANAASRRRADAHKALERVLSDLEQGMVRLRATAGREAQRDLHFLERRTERLRKKLAV